MHKLHPSYSNSTAQTRGARAQSPMRKKTLRKKTVTHHLPSNIFIRFFKACANTIHATNIFPNSSESFINAKQKEAPSTLIYI